MAKNKKKEKTNQDKDEEMESEEKIEFIESQDLLLKSLSRMFILSGNVIDMIRKKENINSKDKLHSNKYYKSLHKITKEMNNRKEIEGMRREKTGFSLFVDNEREIIKNSNTAEFIYKDFDFMTYVKRIVKKWMDLDDLEREQWNEIAVNEYLKMHGYKG